MPAHAVEDACEAVLGGRHSQIRLNLVEVQVLEQLEAGRAEDDLRVLQRLYGAPAAVLGSGKCAPPFTTIPGR